MKRKKILICSDGGGDENGGIYEYQLDAMLKHAPRLASSTKVPVKHLSTFRTDFADVVVIFQKKDDTISFRIDLINIGVSIASKGGVKVFLITSDYPVNRRGSCHTVWEIHYNWIMYRLDIQDVYYQFKRCGGKKFQLQDRNFDSDGFRGIDWRKLQDYILQED